MNLTEITNLLSGSRLKRVTFIKKDGSLRHLVGFPSSHTKLGKLPPDHPDAGLKYDPDDFNLLCMFDFTEYNRALPHNPTEEERNQAAKSSYRMVALDRVVEIKTNGQVYKVQ